MIAHQPVNCLAVMEILDRLLNYPSISVTFPQTWNSTTLLVVKCKVKNVGELPSVYYAVVDMPGNIVIVGLEFTEANQEECFLVIVWPRQSGTRVVQGALQWVYEMHTVWSPISITLA